MPDTLAWLTENERSFRALVSALAGRPVDRSVIWRWRKGITTPSATERAMIELVRRKPELMEQGR